jgi:hypothetical protein
MTLKGLDAAAALERGLLGVAAAHARRAELPHLDGLVQAAADKLPSVGRERHTIDAIFVAVGPFQTLEEVAHLDVPHAHALVERAGSHELRVGRDGDGRDAVLDGEGEAAGARLKIPNPDGAIATAGRDGAAVAGKVEGVDVLVVASKGVADLPRLDVPDLAFELAPCSRSRGGGYNQNSP